MSRYEELKRGVQDRLKLSRPAGISDEQRIDWAYGNARLENPLVTRDMAVSAVAKRRTEGT